MRIVTVGIDLAKNVFAVHGVDDAGKAVLVKPKVTRDQLPALIAQLPPCLIGMEACSGRANRDTVHLIMRIALAKSTGLRGLA